LDCSGGRREGRGRQGGHASRRACGGKDQRAQDDPLRELDLEAVVARGLCAREGCLGGASKCGRLGAGARKRRFRLTRAPWLGGDAAECEAPSLIVSPSMTRPAAADTRAKA